MLSRIIDSSLTRSWDARRNKWYYHTIPGMEEEMEGHTGSAVVFVLVVLLWLYASYRLWVVWEYKLNFEQVLLIIT